MPFEAAHDTGRVRPLAVEFARQRSAVVERGKRRADRSIEHTGTEGSRTDANARNDVVLARVGSV